MEIFTSKGIKTKKKKKPPKMYSISSSIYRSNDKTKGVKKLVRPQREKKKAEPEEKKKKKYSKYSKDK